MIGFEWDWGIFFQYLPTLLAACGATILAALISFTIALLLGLALALLRETTPGLIRWIAAWMGEFIRRTPILVQIYFVYYVLPDFGLTLSALTAGILTLGIHYATYLSEVYRAGLHSVPRGQWDACIALGLGRYTTLRHVILPQALVPITPALGNYLIVLFKETPLLSAISVVEMLQRAKIIGSLTFRYTEPLTTVALIFLILSLAAAVILRRLEARLTQWRAPLREDFDTAP